MRRSFFGWVQGHRLAISAAILIVQAGVLVLDVILLPHETRLPWLALAEALAPWLFFPLVRRFGAPALEKFIKTSRSASMVLDFCFQIFALLLFVLLAFQILQWAFVGEFHGGIFYLGASYGCLVNGLTRKNIGAAVD